MPQFAASTDRHEAANLLYRAEMGQGRSWDSRCNCVISHYTCYVAMSINYSQCHSTWILNYRIRGNRNQVADHCAMNIIFNTSDTPPSPSSTSSPRTRTSGHDVRPAHRPLARALRPVRRAATRSAPCARTRRGGRWQPSAPITSRSKATSSSTRPTRSPRPASWPTPATSSARSSTTIVAASLPGSPASAAPTHSKLTPTRLRTAPPRRSLPATPRARLAVTRLQRDHLSRPVHCQQICNEAASAQPLYCQLICNESCLWACNATTAVDGLTLVGSLATLEFSGRLLGLVEHLSDR